MSTSRERALFDVINAAFLYSYIILCVYYYYYITRVGLYSIFFFPTTPRSNIIIPYELLRPTTERRVIPWERRENERAIKLKIVVITMT